MFDPYYLRASLVNSEWITKYFAKRDFERRLTLSIASGFDCGTSWYFLIFSCYLVHCYSGNRKSTFPRGRRRKTGKGNKIWCCTDALCAVTKRKRSLTYRQWLLEREPRADYYNAIVKGIERYQLVLVSKVVLPLECGDELSRGRRKRVWYVLTRPSHSKLPRAVIIAWNWSLDLCYHETHQPALTTYDVLRDGCMLLETFLFCFAFSNLWSWKSTLRSSTTMSASLDLEEYKSLHCKWLGANEPYGVLASWFVDTVRSWFSRVEFHLSRKRACGGNLNSLRLVWGAFQLYRAVQASWTGWDDLIEWT